MTHVTCWLSKANPDGLLESYSYDAAGNVVTYSYRSLAEPVGYQTVYTYDALNRLARSEGADGEFTQIDYDILGNITATENNERVITFTYDALNRQHRETDEQGNSTTQRYDVFGNMISVSVLMVDEAAQTTREEATTYRYDALNRLVAQTDALGNALLTSDADEYTQLRFELGYVDGVDANLGRAVGDLTLEERAAISDAYSTVFDYDDAGNVIAERRPSSQVTHYRYDGAGRQTRMLSALGYQTEYVLDLVGNTLEQRVYQTAQYTVDQFNSGVLIASDYQTLRTERYAFDALNRIDVATDQAGVRTQYHYDDVSPDFVTSTTTISSTEVVRENGRLSYDAEGRVISTTDAVGVTTRLTLNPRGNVVRRVEAVGAEKTRTTTYLYDQGGSRLRAEITEAGRITVLDYEGDSDRTTSTKIYDAGSLAEGSDLSTLTGLKTALLGSTAERTESWTYFANGQLATHTDAIGTQTAYTWEGILQKSVTYGVGKQDGYSEVYHYDAKGRVAQLDTDFVYLGNDVVSTRFIYDANDNILVRIEAVGIEGKERSTAYEYDTQNRLIKETNPEGESVRYFYDANDRLVMTEAADKSFLLSVFNSAGQVEYTVQGRHDATTTQLPDGTLWQRVNWEAYFLGNFVISAYGGIKTEYIYDSFDSQNAVAQTVSFANTRSVSISDANYAAITAKRTTYFQYDALGRIVATVDDVGYATLFEHDEFGNISKITNGAYRPDLAGLSENPNRAARINAQVTTFHYDDADNIVLTVDGRGQAVAATFDVLGNRLSQTTGIANTDASLVKSSPHPPTLVSRNLNCAPRPATSGTPTARLNPNIAKVVG